MTREDVEAFLTRELPELRRGERAITVEEIGPSTARLRSDGGGPTASVLMALAELALQAAVLARIGPVALATTRNLSFTFLRTPGPEPLVAECRLVKLGRRLAVGEIGLHHEGQAELVCHATATCSIPAR